MRTSPKRLIGLSGLIILSALLAACGGEPLTLETFTSPDETAVPESTLAIPDLDPSLTSPPPAPAEEESLPTAAVEPRETELPRLTPIPLPEETPPMEAHPTAPPQAQEAVEAARAFLARHLEIRADEIELLSVEFETWSDSSLGCPQPGHSYLQVITPGYRMVFEAGGREYEVHTDRTGRQVVLCTGRMPGGRVPPYSEE